MIIIKREATTYFINDIWLFFLSFLLGKLIILIFKSYWNKRKLQSDHSIIDNDNKSKGTLFGCRGGDLDIKRVIEKCLKEEGIYQVKKEYVKDVIKSMTNTKHIKDAISVNVTVLVTALVASKTTAMALRTYNWAQVTVIVTNQYVAKAMLGLGLLASGTPGILAVLQVPGMVPVTVGAITVFLGANVLLNRINCDELFHKLPMFNQTSSYIETIAESKDKIYIQTSPEQNLFIPSGRGTNQITIVTLNSKRRFMCPAQEKVGLERSSKNEYVKLPDRTKTLQDIVQGDDTEVRQNSDIILEELARRAKADKINVFIEQRE